MNYDELQHIVVHLDQYHAAQTNLCGEIYENKLCVCVFVYNTGTPPDRTNRGLKLPNQQTQSETQKTSVTHSIPEVIHTHAQHNLFSHIHKHRHTHPRQLFLLMHAYAHT